MNILEGRTLTQHLQHLADALRDKVSNVPPPAAFLGTFVYEGRIAVADFLVNGLVIAFDVFFEEHGFYRIEVFDRKKDTPGVLAALKYEHLSGSRFLVKKLSAPAGEAAIAEAISQVILEALHLIGGLGKSAEDALVIDCIKLGDPLVVVDIGANPLDMPPYALLFSLGLCHLVGFEPQEEAFKKLQSNKRDNETYFPFAIGANGETDLNIYAMSGFTSIYKIDENTIGAIADQKGWFETTRLKQTVKVDCKALDDVPGLPAFDLLKIDIQGGELNVFQNARRALTSALCVIPEVSFFPLYEAAPSFADIHQELTAQGFLLHKFMFQKREALSSSYARGALPSIPKNQLIDGDAVYLKDIRVMDRFSARDLKVLALLGHFVFSSKDLVVRMLEELCRRGENSKDALDSYIAGNFRA